jgi:hypothetical protein
VYLHTQYFQVNKTNKTKPESKLNSKRLHDEFLGDISLIDCGYKNFNSSLKPKNNEMILEVSFICNSKEECERSMDYDNYIIEVDFLRNLIRFKPR